MSQHESAGKPAAKCPFGHSSAPAVGLADTLKEQTKAAHAMAERHPIQARMVKGESTREQYGAYLGQLLPVWKAIDAGLWVKAASDPRIASMVKPYHANAGRVAADLAFLGTNAGEVLPATDTAIRGPGEERERRRGHRGRLVRARRLDQRRQVHRKGSFTRAWHHGPRGPHEL